LRLPSRGLSMIRTVWLATICLMVLSALAVGNAFRTPAEAIDAERLAEEMTVGTRPAQDTLSKADRLEITYVRQEMPQPADQPTGQLAPVIEPSPPPIQTKIASRHWHDRNAVSSTRTKAKQPKQARTNKKKSKIVDRKHSQAADRSKPTEPTKPCGRPGALGDFLRSLHLSPACDT
jgi:hypothetical protein